MSEKLDKRIRIRNPKFFVNNFDFKLLNNTLQNLKKYNYSDLDIKVLTYIIWSMITDNQVEKYESIHSDWTRPKYNYYQNEYFNVIFFNLQLKYISEALDEPINTIRKSIHRLLYIHIKDNSSLLFKITSWSECDYRITDWYSVNFNELQKLCKTDFYDEIVEIKETYDINDDLKYINYPNVKIPIEREMKKMRDLLRIGV